MNNDPTICAIATAQGGAIGIIRVSGNEAIEITEKIFSPAGKADRQLHDRAPYSIAFGRITDGKGETVDEVLVSVSVLLILTRAKTPRRFPVMARRIYCRG